MSDSKISPFFEKALWVAVIATVALYLVALFLSLRTLFLYGFWSSSPFDSEPDSEVVQITRLETGSGSGSETGSGLSVAVEGSAHSAQSTVSTSSIVPEEPPIVPEPPIESTPREDVPSALHDISNPEHPEPLVDLFEIRPVVPPDAIPALDDPVFEAAGEVDWLPQMEPVLVLEINGDARAYPLRIMTWHEIVNGTVGGAPVTVSYCPLCNSAIVYDRRLGERILDFGTSGALLNSSLVMYDRQTESLWSHYTGRAVAGHLTGYQLDLLPAQIVSFKAFVSAYPQGRVLSFNTGHMRQYGQNPYNSYDDPDGTPNAGFFFGALDDRLAPMTRVVAVRGEEESVVITYDVLAQQRVVPFTFEGKELVALYAPGTVSALDTGIIAEGRDVGATGVFIATVNDRTVDLVPAPGVDSKFVDLHTLQIFDILGFASGGVASGEVVSSDTGVVGQLDSADELELVGEVQLKPVEHLDTFWFAVSAFYPNAHIIKL